MTPLSDARDWSGVEEMAMRHQGDHIKLDRGKHKVRALHSGFVCHTSQQEDPSALELCPWLKEVLQSETLTTYWGSHET
ncbi:hypothetical protein NDU88_001712 [Pleurodeles waltl]|uniref:Uncharacterized protein n=1 Tax=Pleurodeles waltl TaxID=8319 RepID=A0AAV7LZD1_PLEWA|nr:hypothetical protein NDU88_001712 [Pleurodeles waltl]